jgi:hypothetical protein
LIARNGLSSSATRKNVMKHLGRCFCGAVELEVTGAPEAMGYCHCSSCRSWSGGPVNAFSLWKPGAVKVTKGEDRVSTFQKTSVGASIARSAAVI